MTTKRLVPENVVFIKLRSMCKYDRDGERCGLGGPCWPDKCAFMEIWKRLEKQRTKKRR